MATAKKHIYGIYYSGQFGLAMCPTKGDTKKDAKSRFKKRYPKRRVVSSVELLDLHSSLYSRWKSVAI